MNDHKVRCGKGHVHPSVAAVKACYLKPVAPVAPPVPVRSATPGVRPHVTHVSEPPTPAQVAYVARLGGVLDPSATRLEASRIIDALLAARKSTVSPVAQPERKSTMQQSRIGIPVEMLFAIREGRWAVSPEGTTDLTFLRTHVIKPYKNGRSRAYQGWMKVQTQHSDDLIDRALISPQGEVKMVSHTMNSQRLTELLLTIITDQKAAAIRYGQAKEQCCHCGKTLTDERSRHYGIGPECEKGWPEVIDEVDANEGPFVPRQMMVN